jgi:hypothetical protein
MKLRERLARVVLGTPKDPRDPAAFHRLSLVALLAWVGLGADGLSSSAYGPEEAFRVLGEHRDLAVVIAAAMVATVLVISYGYSRIIEQFPGGGGGYLVSSKVLGGPAGVVAGAALLVDYVLTITISMAAGADAIFSFLPAAWREHALWATAIGIVILTVMNLRGVKESVTSIAPVFGLFIVTHVVLLAVALGARIGELPALTHEVGEGLRGTSAVLGLGGTIALALRAYSLGGGTYTGIEAVSNGVGIMREPRVETARHTMWLMATSLSICASGLLLGYLLWDARPTPGQTMNAVLLDRVAGDWSLFGVHVGPAFVVTALVSEGALLAVAAQAGFVDGPRVMANMAVDSWLPHRFSALSDRLTMRNGIVLMGAAAIAALVYTAGQVSRLVVMYSINVFVTFALSNIAMSVFWIRQRKVDPKWLRHLPAHAVAAALCVTILAVTLVEKFLEGGWITLALTSALVALCFAIRRHYRAVGRAIEALDARLSIADRVSLMPRKPEAPGAPDADEPVAILLVGGYGGLGRHALITLLRMFPDHYAGVVFVSVAVVDSDVFKGASELPALEARTRASLAEYEKFAHQLGLRCESDLAIGTEVTAEAVTLALRMSRKYPRGMVVAGQLVFSDDTAWNRALHNETAFQIQRRLQHEGVPMVVLPVLLDIDDAARTDLSARPVLP